MVTNKIKIIDSALDYYPLEPKELILGRQYDNESDIIEIERPKEEKDSICTMIITDQNGTLIDHIIMENNTYRIKNNVSENKIVKVGFSFARQDGYVKNSAILIGRFLEAQKPDGFVPMQPEQQINIDYLISYGFTDSKYENGEIQFFNMKGNKVVSINIGKLIQEQSDWLEKDPTNNSYIKNKPTKTSDFENDGEDGSSPFATKNFVEEGDANLNSQIIATNNILTEKANKSDLNNYYTKEETYTKSEVDSKVTNIYKYKGSVQTYADLPTENNQAGDVWNVIEKYESYPAGTNFAWTPDGTWDALGGTIEVDVGEPIAEAIRDNTTQIVPTSGGLKLGGAESAHYKGIAIGENAKTSGNVGIAIGLKTVADGNWNVAIGNNAYAFSEAIGLGYNAKAKNNKTIQLGEGTNTTDNSFQIYNDNIYKTNTHTLTVQNLQIGGVDEYPTLSGADAPTTTTVGKVKQFYVETTTPALYYCSSITGTGTTEDPYVYNWTQAGGADEELRNNTVQIAPTSGGLAIGGANKPVYETSIAIGKNANTGSSAVAIGLKAVAANGLVAIGRQAVAAGDESIAIGYNTKASATKSIIIDPSVLNQNINSTSNSFQIASDNIYKFDTHTLTVQNAQVNGNNVYGVLQGETDPTEATAGAVGQFYISTATDPASLYLCTKVETVDSTTTYTWTKQGGKQLYQHNVVMTWNKLRIITFQLINDNSTAISNGSLVQEALFNAGFTNINNILPCNCTSLDSNRQETFDGLYYIGQGSVGIYYKTKRTELYKIIQIDNEDKQIIDNINLVSQDSFGAASMNSVKDTVVAL